MTICTPSYNRRHEAMKTLPIHLGLERVHTATHRGCLEDLVYLESLDAEAEERLITWGCALFMWD